MSVLVLSEMQGPHVTENECRKNILQMHEIIGTFGYHCAQAAQYARR